MMFTEKRHSCQPSPPPTPKRTYDVSRGKIDMPVRLPLFRYRWIHCELDIDSWKEHHKISITSHFVYLLRGENRYPVLKTVSIWPRINTKL